MQLPERADVVIIGGGIIGCSTAYFLAKRGLRVVLCEKGRFGAEQSTRNWGFVRQQGRAPAELPLMLQSLAIWQGLAQELSADVGFFQGGTLYLSDDDTRQAANLAWLEHAKTYGLDTRMLGQRELKRLCPAMQASRRGALYTPSDARAEPRQAMAAWVKGCRRVGVRLLSRCAVRGVELAAGAVCGVVTEHASLRAPQVVLAGGAWSSYFCRALGVSLPQLKVVGSVMATAPGPAVVQASLWGNDLGLRRRQDGGYNVACSSIVDADITPDYLRYGRDFLPALRHSKQAVRLRLGPRFVTELRWPGRWRLDRPTVFEQQRTLNPRPNLKLLQRAHRRLGEVFPPLYGLPVRQRWAGMIDVTPDELPVIDAVATVPGLFVSTGYSGHGFGIGPAAGKATSELVLGQPPSVDLAAFRLGRF